MAGKHHSSGIDGVPGGSAEQSFPITRSSERPSQLPAYDQASGDESRFGPRRDRAPVRRGALPPLPVISVGLCPPIHVKRGHRIPDIIAIAGQLGAALETSINALRPNAPRRLHAAIGASLKNDYGQRVGGVPRKKGGSTRITPLAIGLTATSPNNRGIALSIL